MNAQIYDTSCKKFAELNFVSAASVRARIHLYGEYFGVKPLKLANGRLAFPNMQVRTIK